MTNTDRIKRLRLLRSQAGWTQAEAAKRISEEGYGFPLSKWTIKSWELGRNPAPGWAIRLLELAIDNRKD